MLFLVFAVLATVLLVLQDLAAKQQLYRSAFVYQVDLHVFGAKFSPHSVIATLLAVGVALWWDAIDKRLRLLQPYLAILDKLLEVRYAAATYYRSSYWLWAAAKALLNRHWLLCVVTVGTTLSQICKLSPVRSSGDRSKLSPLSLIGDP
jgi:hypothetical protein